MPSREDDQFQVVITGAFSTGTSLRVPVPEYRGLQERLDRQLNGKPEPGQENEPKEWNPEGVRWLEQPSYDEGGGGYSNLVPLVLIQREGDELAADVERRESAAWVANAARRAEQGEAPSSPREPGWRWQLRDVRIQLFDLGVGVIVGVYGVRLPEGAQPGWAAKRIREWSNLTRGSGRDIALPVGATYELLAKDTVRKFRAAVREVTGELPDPWLRPNLIATDDRPGETLEQRERGRLKWLHPVFVLPAAEGASKKAMEKDAEAFRSVHNRCAPFEHGLFVPGVKKSVVVLAGERRGEDLLGPTTPLGLITLNWAYYALLMDIDRGLLATLDQSRRDSSDSFQQLERDAKKTYEDYVRVAEAKARLDSALNGLGAGQMGLWEAIVDVTRFGQLAKGVDSKLDVLQTIAENRVQEAAAKSARRSRQILTGLTALTVVTVAFALIDYLLGGQADRSGHDEVRIWVLAGAALLALCLFAVAEWGPGRKIFGGKLFADPKKVEATRRSE